MAYITGKYRHSIGETTAVHEFPNAKARIADLSISKDPDGEQKVHLTLNIFDENGKKVLPEGLSWWPISRKNIEVDGAYDSVDIEKVENEIIFTEKLLGSSKFPKAADPENPGDDWIYVPVG